MKDDQPTTREILDAVLRFQDVMAGAIGRIELDIRAMKADIIRIERRVLRIDDRLAVIESR
jgi:hypothetical protein